MNKNAQLSLIHQTLARSDNYFDAPISKELESRVRLIDKINAIDKSLDGDLIDKLSSEVYPKKIIDKIISKTCDEIKKSGQTQRDRYLAAVFDAVMAKHGLRLDGELGQINSRNTLSLISDTFCALGKSDIILKDKQKRQLFACLENINDSSKLKPDEIDKISSSFNKSIDMYARKVLDYIYRKIYRFDRNRKSKGDKYQIQEIYLDLVKLDRIEKIIDDDIVKKVGECFDYINEHSQDKDNPLLISGGLDVLKARYDKIIISESMKKIIEDKEIIRKTRKI